jgi:hypothetical protein
MADRLMISEALDAVSRMIRGYPQKACADGYIGAIAETFMHYPKSIALACADPFNGVALQSPEFLPSQSQVIGWCEKRGRLLYEEAAREDRIAQQLEDREAWQNGPRAPEALAKTQAWLDRSDPVAQALISNAKAEDNKRHEAAMAKLQDANRKIFAAECKRAGIDPAGGVSPALAALIADAKKEHALSVSPHDNITRGNT